MNVPRYRTLVGIGAATAAAVAARAIVRRRRAIELADAVVLITGGSRGLGLVLAREFGRRGAHVAICARDADTLERARADLARRGLSVLAVRCDVTDRHAVGEMIDEVRRRFGHIDVLVNNAGIIQVGPMQEMTLEDYESAMRTNFWAALYTTLAVLPEMRARRRGRIVNVASIGGKLSVPHLLPYSASKFALVGLSEGLRAELSDDDVMVTTVCPGLMRTGSPRHARFKGRHREEYAWFSISDALPGTSMNVERAARHIVRACRLGQAEVILSVPAKLAATAAALAPGLTADILGLVQRWLPAPGGIGTASASGRESESSISPSVLTTLGDTAARRHNQAG